MMLILLHTDVIISRFVLQTKFDDAPFLFLLLTSVIFCIIITSRDLKSQGAQTFVLQYIFLVVSGGICYLYPRLVCYRRNRDFLPYYDVQKMASLKTDSTA